MMRIPQGGQCYMVSFFYSLAGNQLFGRRIVMSDFFALAAVIEEVTDGFSGFVYSRTLYDGGTRRSLKR